MHSPIQYTPRDGQVFDTRNKLLINLCLGWSAWDRDEWPQEDHQGNADCLRQPWRWCLQVDHLWSWRLQINQPWPWRLRVNLPGPWRPEVYLLGFWRPQVDHLGAWRLHVNLSGPWSTQVDPLGPRGSSVFLFQKIVTPVLIVVGCKDLTAIDSKKTFIKLLWLVQHELISIKKSNILGINRKKIQPSR